jgi:hypothetical protein
LLAVDYSEVRNRSVSHNRIEDQAENFRGNANADISIPAPSSGGDASGTIRSSSLSPTFTSLRQVGLAQHIGFEQRDNFGGALSRH